VVIGTAKRPLAEPTTGAARAGAAEADVDGVTVVHALGEADDTIAAIAGANRGAVVVTADRDLAARVRAANAEVVGPTWLFARLVD
jgi:8-oxo-dGTP diphosphatase